MEFGKNSLSRHISIKQIRKNCPKYIPTGFDKLDKLLGGGLTPNLYVLGAVSSLGKSAFFLQIAEDIASRGIPVLYFSLEMPVEYIAVISLSRQLYRQRTGNGAVPEISELMNESKIDSFIDGSPEFENSFENIVKTYAPCTEEFYVIERKDIMLRNKSAAFSVEKIRAVTEEFIAKNPDSPPVVIVDYLQLLQADDNAANFTERQIVDHNIIRLWSLAHQLNIPVAVISSVSRTNYEKAIGLASFKESGGIEFSADIVLGMQFPNAGDSSFDLVEAKKANPRELELVVLKNRYGPGSVSTYFKYYPAHGFFEEVENTLSKNAGKHNAQANGTAKSPSVKQPETADKKSADASDKRHNYASVANDPMLNDPMFKII